MIEPEVNSEIMSEERQENESFNSFMHDLIITISQTLQTLEVAEAKLSDEDYKKKLKEAIEHTKSEIKKELSKNRPEENETGPGPKGPGEEDSSIPLKREIAKAIDEVENELVNLNKYKKKLNKEDGSAAFGWLKVGISVDILKSLAIIKAKLKEKPLMTKEDGTFERFEDFVGNEGLLISLLMIHAIYKGRDGEIPLTFKENKKQYDQVAGMSGDHIFSSLTSNYAEIDNVISTLNALIQRIQDGINGTKKHYNIPVINPRGEGKKV